MRPNYLQETQKRIASAPAGYVFVASDLADIAENRRISVCLERMTKENMICRIMRGVYYKPEFSKLLGEIIAPAPDAVAHAIARNYGWTIVPSGDTALNILGLSTQVPSVWSYVSDGTYKEYSYDRTTISFKRTTNKEISRLSEKTAIVIQALKALGKEHIDDEIIEKIKSITSDEERTVMLTEAQYSTSWIYEIIKRICR